MQNETTDPFDPVTFLSDTANVDGKSRREGVEIDAAYHLDPPPDGPQAGPPPAPKPARQERAMYAIIEESGGQRRVTQGEEILIDLLKGGEATEGEAYRLLFLAKGGGSIANIASVAGLRGVADRAAYNTSKHGLIGLTRTLAAEWGGRGVRVNAVCPGWVKTEMDHASQAEGAYGDRDITDHVPMGRFAQPDDIAQAVAFLADPARSGFVNGLAMSVDGGWNADGSWQSLRLGSRSRR